MNITVQGLAGALRETAAFMSAKGDSSHAKQVQELSSKLTDGRLTVALCGHFSAGKSTLVNRLCGADLLPSSPIPTSANVVSIQGGERAYAEVVTEKDGLRQRSEASIDGLDRYCVDGEQFVSVSITYPSELLGNHTMLLDTPGIDSTDDAHRLATESALHLADVVFYVMDYNHVQSEINFSFAKELKDWGKPLYFIVNQIDKHRDRELPFETYRQSVEDAFHAWHLEPAGIVYLSLRKPEHPHHEWDKLIGLLDRLKDRKAELCSYSVDASLRHIAKEHGKLMEEQASPERDRLLDEAGGQEAAARLADEMESLRSRIAELEQGRETFRGELRMELQSLLDNANITPAALRDLAHQFLDSRKPGFKAGLLFAGAKTAAEQERRLEAFRSELLSLISAGIEWHAKQLLRKAAESIGYDGSRLEEALAAELSWQPDAAWLLQRVKSGAVFGNEYTMTYSKEMASDAKAEYRRRALGIIDELTAFKAAGSEAEAARLQAELGELRQRAGALEMIAKLDGRIAEHNARLAAMLPERAARPELPSPADIPAGGQSGAVTGERAPAAEQAAAALDAVVPAQGRKPGQGWRTGGQSAALSRQHAAAARLLAAAELLAAEPSLASATASMREKAGRLQNGRFTIALFGAFSAGKSSLANALVGEPVLPVSPNPTTAAINRLVPPDERFGHGTARIAMKSRDAMLGDLRYSLALLGEDASEKAMPDAAAILRAIDRLSPESIGAGGRPHYSFLRAARKGWADQERHLGSELKAEASDYVRYVAEESLSCFVSEIDYYYSCGLTDEGIVLVDTPGADSVNARHTGVAFNYIKNADAVLFVTYYNHAFSQADRQFLDQLGRVKDQFELDKMFFIVNAADLAADEEELQGVLKHVETNLQQHGIRSPRLFPVSSLQALDGKMDHNAALMEQSGIIRFQDSFLNFIQNDLGRLAAESAEMELQRAASKVEGWLQSAEGDAEQKASALQRLTEATEQAKEAARRLRGVGTPEGLKQDISELMYYIIQRLQYRFGDFYNLAFNPASLKNDGTDLKRLLWTAWLELERLIGMELSQELLATTMRVEKTLGVELKKPYEACAAEMAELLEGYKPLPFGTVDSNAPQQAAVWTGADVEAKWLWSRFKSPRQFFEGGGKDALRQELETLIAPALQSWMNGVKADWLLHYDKEWRLAAEASGDSLRNDMSVYAEGKQRSLADSTYVEQLRQLHTQLIHL